MLNQSTVLSERAHFHPSTSAAAPIPLHGVILKQAVKHGGDMPRRSTPKRMSCKTCQGKCCTGLCRF